MSVFVTIDSRDRDRAAHDASDYTVTLPECVRDVRAVKLRSTDIPPMWNVPPGRTAVWVSEGGGGVRVDLRPGHYPDASAAAAQLQAALNSSPLALAYTVTADSLGRLSVSAGGAFSLRGGDGSSEDGYGPSAAGRVLGFGPAETPSDPSGLLVAPHCNQLSATDTMYVHVEDFDGIIGNARGAGQALDIVNPTGGDFYYDSPAVKHFRPPLSRIQKLRIRIVDYYGAPVYFDNREHRIDIEFLTDGRQS